MAISLHRMLILLTLCGLGVVLWAQGVTTPVATPLSTPGMKVPQDAPVPVAPPPVVPAYGAPDLQAVLKGETPLRVLLVTRQTMLAWKGEDAVRILPSNAEPLHVAKAGEQVGLVRASENQSCWLRKDGQNFCAIPTVIRLESAKPIKLWTPAPNQWVAYDAPLVIIPMPDGTFNVAQEASLEEYLRGVLPAEMPASFHPQALRAQAIIARTYTLTKLGRHAAEGADLCATEHCQVWGATKRASSTDEAVRVTRGVVLMERDKLAATYYHACCGGATDDAVFVWGVQYAKPYLTGTVDFPGEAKTSSIIELLARDDTYCKRANTQRWEKTFSPAEIDALVARNLAAVTGDAVTKIAHVTQLAVEERTPFGRVASLRVEGDGASVVVYGDQIRWLFGTGKPGANGLWSTLFDLTAERDANGQITRYILRGSGRGHGLGLCQWGADGRARAGQDFRAILNAYYPGTRLGNEKP